jgi:hypothetical protein
MRPDPAASDPVLAAAIALAGRLAELGETRLTLHQPGLPSQALAARSTDLPTVLTAAMSSGNATLSAETLNIRIALTPTGPHPADAQAANILARKS